MLVWPGAEGRWFVMERAVKISGCARCGLCAGALEWRGARVKERDVRLLRLGEIGRFQCARNRATIGRMLGGQEDARYGRHGQETAKREPAAPCQLASAFTSRLRKKCTCKNLNASRRRGYSPPGRDGTVVHLALPAGSSLPAASPASVSKRCCSRAP